MKIRTSTLAALKQKEQRFACLTSYDALTAEIFDQAGIEVILVGDSASNTVLANDGTVPITLDEMLIFGRAVTRSAKSALVVLDMPFGSYEISTTQALENGIRAMKESGVAALKIEGARTEQIRALVDAGIPVMGHVGFTPQSVHALGGFKVQGRGEAAEKILQDCLAIQQAGAFAVVLEMVPAELAARITKELTIPTIGIGAGNQTDAQILVWTDFAGLGEKSPSFAKQYLNLRASLMVAAQSYRAEIQSGEFPAADKNFS
ncbi:MAG: 3-methyl-2-oxobutanoate hydroxymethyltransferase [Actinomycetota bacterium]|nr:3-methyl-2-oxobutanoate hydroxymethyltransferase [Actinomycetota bacterium]